MASPLLTQVPVDLSMGSDVRGSPHPGQTISRTTSAGSELEKSFSKSPSMGHAPVDDVEHTVQDLVLPVPDLSQERLRRSSSLRGYSPSQGPQELFRTASGRDLQIFRTGSGKDLYRSSSGREFCRSPSGAMRERRGSACSLEIPRSGSFKMQLSRSDSGTSFGPLVFEGRPPLHGEDQDDDDEEVIVLKPEALRADSLLLDATLGLMTPSSSGSPSASASLIPGLSCASPIGMSPRMDSFESQRRFGPTIPYGSIHSAPGSPKTLSSPRVSNVPYMLEPHQRVLLKDLYDLWDIASAQPGDIDDRVLITTGQLKRAGIGLFALGPYEFDVKARVESIRKSRDAGRATDGGSADKPVTLDDFEQYFSVLCAGFAAHAFDAYIESLLSRTRSASISRTSSSFRSTSFSGEDLMMTRFSLERVASKVERLSVDNR